MRKPLLGEGTRCFLKGVTPLIILLYAAFTLLLWSITLFSAYGAEPTRVLTPAMPAMDEPTADAQLYVINLIRDPENLLVTPGASSREVRKIEQAQALFAQGKVGAAAGRHTFRVVFYAKGINGKPLAAYDVLVSDGKGLLRVPRAFAERAGSMTMEAPDGIKAQLKNPLSGMLNWYDWELLHVVRGRPKHGWFVLK